MRIFLAVFLSLSAVSSWAGNLLFTKETRIGRVSHQGLFELHDVTIAVKTFNSNGDPTQTFVYAAFSLYDSPGDQYLKELRERGASVTAFYLAENVKETLDCLGQNFVYRVYDSSGNPYETCYVVEVSQLVY